ncbi:hypothetical protein H4Q26_006172 [Puccinia striiformis f. sp. tritici PST-130]|nr:hypothetical protein H4Q26_006172 [Puccinia striiformis f. sp. tritici PST-130]
MVIHKMSFHAGQLENNGSHVSQSEKRSDGCDLDYNKFRTLECVNRVKSRTGSFQAYSFCLGDEAKGSLEVCLDSKAVIPVLITPMPAASGDARMGPRWRPIRLSASPGARGRSAKIDSTALSPGHLTPKSGAKSQVAEWQSIGIRLLRGQVGVKPDPLRRPLAGWCRLTNTPCIQSIYLLLWRLGRNLYPSIQTNPLKPQCRRE